MGNTVYMNRGPATDRESVATDPHLRHLLRAGRRAAGNLSQKAAALRAGISSVYWQKIESGTQPTAPVGTLASMFTATGITAERLRAEGYPDIAAAVDELARLTAPEISTEDYLAATPGASAEEISFLQAALRALRSGRTTEPLEAEFDRNDRRRK